MVCKRLKAGASLLGLLILNLALGACGQQLEALSPELSQKAERARTASLDWVSTAIETTENLLDLQSFSQIQSVLMDRPILAASGSYAAVCNNEMTIAFVIEELATSNIYLCDRAMDIDTAELAQILLHEASHIIGHRDECEATYNEIEIVSLASRVPFFNGYVNECGLNHSH